MTTWLVSIYCPAMPVGGRPKRTAIEKMVATLTNAATGQTVTINPVTIPATPVDRIGIGHWQVEACEGVSADGSFVVSLPPEPVLLDWPDLARGEVLMIAQAISAAIAWSYGGQQGAGVCEFPDCPTNVITGIAAAVTATGTVTFP